jgi:hypothetical protein
MDPFESHNPLQPFGLPSDPMEDVLSLQAYNQGDVERPTEPIITNGCTITIGCS